MFSTGSLARVAQSAHEASGVSGRRLPGRLLSLALSAICDIKNLIGMPKLPLRLKVACWWHWA